MATRPSDPETITGVPRSHAPGAVRSMATHESLIAAESSFCGVALEPRVTPSLD
jgi:hypothetical protein